MNTQKPMSLVEKLHLITHSLENIHHGMKLMIRLKRS